MGLNVIITSTMEQMQYSKFGVLNGLAMADETLEESSSGVLDQLLQCKHTVFLACKSDLGCKIG